MDSESSDKDLPLMANVDEILVEHYSFQLSCSFEKQKFYGHVIMELMPLTNHCTAHKTKLDSTEHYTNETKAECDSDLKDFIFILDCNDIIIHSVNEVIMDDFCKRKFKGTLSNSLETRKLNFAVEKWSLKIWKPCICCSCHFPRLIKIDYETKPTGQSVMWVKDQDCRPAVYTYGAWVNNRSLYPCQEPPTAMATWEAHISVVEPAVVLMSGDNVPSISSNEGIATYYYFTKMKLPLSTLALAVGFWSIDDQSQGNGNVTCRICASSSILSKAIKEFSGYTSQCLTAVESLLGPYPFSRIDFLVVPRGFCSLGMASPNIIFLSQSLLSNNQSMCCRLAHEIAHAWFGLMIGALDWTEEWLSEGFATFMEDLIHTKALNMNSIEERKYCEIKAHFRLKTLLAEIGNTEEELQVLRPNKGEIKTETVDGIHAVILKNGRNSEKAFMQVHYIKGYFLLKYMSDLVGLPAFLKFLNLYVVKYKGQLVESTEMLAFFVETFPEKCGHDITVDGIVSDWLHTSGLPVELLNFELSSAKSVFQTSLKEAQKWKLFNKRYLKRNSKRKKYDQCEFSLLSSEKLLILLDDLLEEKKLFSSTLKHLEEVYNLENQDAEIRHKWCELIIKHRFRPGYACVKNFLLNDLAMGIYLYGELILNGTLSQRQLAEESFKQVRDEMEPNCIVTIEQMLQTASKE